jgi:hypothetical protein
VFIANPDDLTARFVTERDFALFFGGTVAVSPADESNTAKRPCAAGRSSHRRERGIAL